MKGERNRKRKLAEARENRNALWLVAGAVAAVAGFCWLLAQMIPLGMPRQMVEAQVARGEKIQTPMHASSNAPAIFSDDVIHTGLSPTGDVSTPAIANSKTKTLVADKYRSVSFAELASFQFTVTPEIADANSNPSNATEEIREQIPETINALNRKPVAITGFLLPINVRHGLTTEFLLLRNQSACCYGLTPKINEWIIVQTTGDGVKPTMDVPITAEGTLHVGEQREEGHLLGIYKLDCDRVLNLKN
jgi:hypothetical protein